VEAIKDALADTATSKEIQTMTRDVLLMWNSIKQLDAAKADRKDVDCFSQESTSRERLADTRLQDVERALQERVEKEALAAQENWTSAQEKWTELERKMDESSKQMSQWEQMWEKLAGHVEDLVAKMSQHQVADANKFPSATARPSSRGGSREPVRDADTVVRSRTHDGDLAITAMIGSATPASTPKARMHSSPEGDSEQTTSRCLQGAKGIVEATLDQALSSSRSHLGAPPRPARPKSASVRRRHDLGRLF